jgi:putative membrane protein
MLRMTILAALLMLTGPKAIAAPFDDLFVRYEAQRSTYELEFARLGKARATRADVRTYAAILVNDHEAAGGALRNLAASKGIEIPSGLTENDRKRLDRLARTRGAEFDKAFVREARRINSEDMRAFRKEAGRTADPEIRSFVSRFLEVDAKHETAARALSEHVVASKAPVIHPPRTGDTMEVVPPPSASSMPVIAPPPSADK